MLPYGTTSPVRSGAESGSPGAAAIFAMVLAKSVFVVLVTLLCTLRCGVHGEGGPAGGGAILAMRGEG